MSQFLRRIRYLFNHRRLDRKLANDMEFHREMAETDGARNFGNTLRLREEARDAWGWTWMERLAQDLRYAFPSVLEISRFPLRRRRDARHR
jgi:hypothetical protein